MVGTEGSVFCYDEINKEKVTSKYFDVRKTREQALVFEIETESGKKFKATSDHLVLTKDGWKMLKELNVNDEIIKV
ncbi:hypothetical protein SHJJP8911_000930 [Staphylococcus lugdunensis]|nr:hypothetical protein [Staphylococcus lugdunensis]MCI2756640.1 hypothetical protein [Staphylococcus lugdunensis]MCI2836187.1 hypothetical protein [Staphylococcus lugdunensis]